MRAASRISRKAGWEPEHGVDPLRAPGVHESPQIGPFRGIGDIRAVFGLPFVVDDEAAGIEPGVVEPLHIVLVYILTGS